MKTTRFLLLILALCVGSCFLLSPGSASAQARYKNTVAIGAFTGWDFLSE